MVVRLLTEVSRNVITFYQIVLLWSAWTLNHWHAVPQWAMGNIANSTISHWTVVYDDCHKACKHHVLILAYPQAVASFIRSHSITPTYEQLRLKLQILGLCQNCCLLSLLLIANWCCSKRQKCSVHYAPLQHRLGTRCHYQLLPAGFIHCMFAFSRWIETMNCIHN
jgi:hypothetical protein